MSTYRSSCYRCCIAANWYTYVLTVLKSEAKLLLSQYSRLTPHAFFKKKYLSNNNNKCK